MLNYKLLINENGGFLNEQQIKIVVKTDPTKMLLVRCGCGRFLTPAQNVEHFIAIIEKEGSDYIRDVCLPANC